MKMTILKKTIIIVCLLLTYKSAFSQYYYHKFIPPPVLSDGWTVLSADNVTQIGGILIKELQKRGYPTPDGFSEIRSQKLSFYQKGYLYDYSCVTQDTARRYTVANINGNVQLLSGNKEVIKSINQIGVLNFQNEIDVIKYVDFFMSSFENENGRIRLIQSVKQVTDFMHPKDAKSGNFSFIHQPKVFKKDAENYQVSTFILQNGIIYQVDLIIKANGDVSILESQGLELKILKEYFDNGGIRFHVPPKQ